jgi:YbgC/YbaW family acyl-CoA thioester hydrolase
MGDRFEALTAAFVKRVTFSEVDAVGYVHHANAAIWFEQAREAYFRKFQVPFVELSKSGIYLAVRELQIRYDEFIGYDDLIEVRVALTKLLRVSLELHYRVDNLRTGKLAVRGSSTMVAVETKKVGEPPGLGRLRFAREQFLPRVLTVDELYEGVVTAPSTQR